MHEKMCNESQAVYDSNCPAVVIDASHKLREACKERTCSLQILRISAIYENSYKITSIFILEKHIIQYTILLVQIQPITKK